MELKAIVYSWDEKEETHKNTNNNKGFNNNINNLLYWDDEEEDNNDKNNNNKGLNNINNDVNDILYWDDEEEDTDKLMFDGALDDAKIIVEHLATDQSRVSSLARLAVAFSPPERRIDLKDIEQIEILLVDGEHIEIVAAVRHEDACARLLVPVQFPTSCGGVSNMEECVLDNIDTLSEDAGHRIEEQTVEDQMFDLQYVLKGTTEMPSWWVNPIDYELIQECDTIKELLNDAEFQNEVKALAMRAINAAGEDTPIVLETVVVTDVGPSGLNFRARTASNVGEKVILEVSYKFSSTTIENADALRATVLGAVAEAST